MTARDHDDIQERLEVLRHLDRLPPDDVTRTAPTVAQQWARQSIPEELR